MRRGFRGVLAGALALIALEVLTQQAAANRVGGLFGEVASGVRRMLAPNIPAIPDRRESAQRQERNEDASTRTEDIAMTPVAQVQGAMAAQRRLRGRP